MSLHLLEPPAAEPITLADAKAWLRVEHADEDTLIGALVRSARLLVETVVGQSLVRQRWRLSLDAWPKAGVVQLPISPVASLVAARIFPASGAATELDLARTSVDLASRPPRVYFAERPPPGRALGGIEIDFAAGFGDPADVPEPFLQAIRHLVAHWYENRAVAAEDTGPLPLAVTALLAPHRALRVA